MTINRYNTLIPAAGLLLAAGLASCHTPAPYIQENTAGGKVELPVIGSPVQAMPAAIVYQVSDDECINRVPATLTPDGKSVLSYPAPSDLRESQKPVSLGRGWWLDRRGLQPNSVFTTYTYEQYGAMDRPPSAAEIMAHIDRSVRITRMVKLPVTAAEAAADPALARAYTENGFAGCTELINDK